jgi:hypothetical protein
MWAWGALAGAHAYLGELDRAEDALRKLEESGRRLDQDTSGPRFFAYLAMHRKEELFAMLQESCEKHPWTLIGLRVEPAFDWMRDDPRFQDQLRRARLS